MFQIVPRVFIPAAQISPTPPPSPPSPSPSPTSPKPPQKPTGS